MLTYQVRRNIILTPIVLEKATVQVAMLDCEHCQPTRGKNYATRASVC